ncbi:pentatricopeptide repeat-containing protein At1g15510, chloroplastic-like [Magnolia sinica]|uniref:pentatricopeptide repeat-containing protein At1g15510, chloroplastic-like n=1 Tax=Magnolia sinica TaxID=86752 RepID=UPI0026580020|nr:pentatricopeptide repeat-containing protein At1g15510, chloroplastic-like [Magnolia sinica]
MTKGKELHGIINRRGFKFDASVANALIDMYGKCGDLEAARWLFDRMPQRDAASWTCMISDYLQRGLSLCPSVVQQEWVLMTSCGLGLRDLKSLPSKSL